MSSEIWKYSDMIDDEDLIMLQKDFITVRDGIDYYGISYRTLVRAAMEAGAFYKIGSKMVRIDRRALEAYFRVHGLRRR